MAKINPAEIWTLNYRLLMSATSAAAAGIEALGLETKELFVLAEVDAHPYPAELAATLNMPRPTITLYVKRLEAAGLMRREIDPADLRRHRLQLTPAGRKLTEAGLKLLSDAFGARLKRLGAAEQQHLKALLERMI